MKTNIITFNGPTGCGKSTYMDHCKRLLEAKGYSVELVHTDGTETPETMESKIAYVAEKYSPRFLLIHHCGKHPGLAGMEIAFFHPQGAMDLHTALHGGACPNRVGYEKEAGK